MQIAIHKLQQRRASKSRDPQQRHRLIGKHDGSEPAIRHQRPSSAARFELPRQSLDAIAPRLRPQLCTQSARAHSGKATVRCGRLLDQQRFDPPRRAARYPSREIQLAFKQFPPGRSISRLARIELAEESKNNRSTPPPPPPGPPWSCRTLRCRRAAWERAGRRCGRSRGNVAAPASFELLHASTSSRAFPARGARGNSASAKRHRRGESRSMPQSLNVAVIGAWPIRARREAEQGQTILGTPAAMERVEVMVCHVDANCSCSTSTSRSRGMATTDAQTRGSADVFHFPSRQLYAGRLVEQKM